MSLEPSGTRLVVFADDWGRHPSSCQHLVRHLLRCYPTLSVNTLGTKAPRAEVQDIGKIAVRLRTGFNPGGLSRGRVST